MLRKEEAPLCIPQIVLSNERIERELTSIPKVNKQVCMVSLKPTCVAKQPPISHMIKEACD